MIDVNYGVCSEQTVSKYGTSFSSQDIYSFIHHLFLVAKGLYLALQLDEEGDAGQTFHPQRVTQCGVTAHLTQTHTHTQ